MNKLYFVAYGLCVRFVGLGVMSTGLCGVTTPTTAAAAAGFAPDDAVAAPGPPPADDAFRERDPIGPTAAADGENCPQLPLPCDVIALDADAAAVAEEVEEEGGGGIKNVGSPHSFPLAAAAVVVVSTGAVM